MYMYEVYAKENTPSSYYNTKCSGRPFPVGKMTMGEICLYEVRTSHYIVVFPTGIFPGKRGKTASDRNELKFFF